jgi:hypothetical protein
MGEGYQSAIAVSVNRIFHHLGGSPYSVAALAGIGAGICVAFLRLRSGQQPETPALLENQTLRKKATRIVQI